MSVTPIPVIEFDTIDSTNAEAHRRAMAGERGPLWLRAAVQEAGRGRSGRAWSSPIGNFSATYMFTSDVPVGVLHHLSFIAGLAAHDAVRPGLPGDVALQLKWPNDLMINGAKCAGILVESARYGDDVVIIIGIGINVVAAPEIPGRHVATLRGCGSMVTAGELLVELAGALEQRLDVWNGGGGFDDIRDAWCSRAHRIGQPISVNTTARFVEGTFAGLAVDGALLLRDRDGEIQRISHGDVALGNAGDAPVTVP